MRSAAHHQFCVTAKETMKTALLLIDIQESFRQRPYWNDKDLPAFLEHTNALIAGAQRLGLPIIRFLHSAGPPTAANPFAPESGLMRPLEGLASYPAAVEIIKQHSSVFIETGFSAWLRQRDIERLIIAGIRSERCCEGSARQARDEGFEVDFVTDATYTFAMTHSSGLVLSPADLKLRTETILHGDFAEVCNVAQALERAASAS